MAEGDTPLKVNFGSDNWHTMSDEAMWRYIESKIHPALKDREDIFRLVVRPAYRWGMPGEIHGNEKLSKRFNYKRPTLSIEREEGDDRDTYFLNCFPSLEYVMHYSEITSLYLERRRQQGLWAPRLGTELPTGRQLKEVFAKSNLKEMTRQDFVILGDIEKMHGLTGNAPFIGNGDFQWSEGTIGANKVALLGCKFSYWGKASYEMTRILAEQGHKFIIYSGKMGGLRPEHKPNRSLGTGNTTMATQWSEPVSWPNLFETLKKKDIHHGNHIGCCSVLDQTKDWYYNRTAGCAFVDQEVDYMAKAAVKYGIGFSYLHLITDNLYYGTVGGRPNLASENLAAVQKDRRKTTQKREKIIRRAIEAYPDIPDYTDLRL